MKTTIAADVIFKINYLGTFEGEGLAAHNKYRKIHKANPLKLNAAMTKQATDYAEVLAAKGSLVLSNSDDGENLYKDCSPGGPSAQRAVKMW